MSLFKSLFKSKKVIAPVIKIRILIRRDMSENWIENNPILQDGEIAVELDTFKYKIGDGQTDWINLNYREFSDCRDFVDFYIYRQ